MDSPCKPIEVFSTTFSGNQMKIPHDSFFFAEQSPLTFFFDFDFDIDSIIDLKQMKI